MGTGYIRQDVADDIDDGKTAGAGPVDAEFDAIEAAFASGSGHTHDGTSAEGGAIEVLGPAQEYVGGASAFYPKTDSNYDLGTVSLGWQNGYFTGTVTATTFTGNLIATSVNIGGGAIDGTIIGANTAAAGTFTVLTATTIGGVTPGAGNFTTLSATGNVDLGNATSDTITFTGRADSDLIPSANNTYDLGSASNRWADLYTAGTSQHEGTFNALGTANFNGDVNLGNAVTDSITFTGRADSDFIPITDSTYDLGSSSRAWAEVHADDVIVGGESLLPVSGTWTARITDSSGNNSSTTVTGDYYTIGDLVFCNFSNLNSISTAGLTGTDDLRLDLPFQCAAGQTAVGGIQVSGLASLTGSGDGQVIVRVIPGSTTARLVNNGTQASGTAAGAANLKVSDIDSGVTSLSGFSVVYKKA